MEFAQFPMLIGWSSMLGGVFSGAALGLNFHKDQWAGGYQSYRRRLFRLGHIAFFGIGFINLLFALSIPHFSFTQAQQLLIIAALLIGTISMPLVCFLSGWRKPFRHLFPLPVISIALALITILSGL